MARPINANAEATRLRILDTASRLFAEQGNAASVRSVARAAGVSLATVHHYYGSKDALYQACVTAMDAEFTQLREELVELVRGGADSFDLLMASAVRKAYRFARDHVVAVRLTTREAIEWGETTSRRQVGTLVPGLKDGVAILERMPGAPPEAIRLVLRSISYLVVRYALTGTRELAVVLGWDPDDCDEAACQQAVEDHLVHVTRAQLVGLSGGAL